MNNDSLHRLQRDTLGYFLNETNRVNGLVPDNTRPGAHASIAAIGFALSAYPVGVERGFITREEGIERTLTTLRFFSESEQSDAPDATGYMGFYYHFLHMDSGRRAWKCELSTIDSAILLAGVLTAAAYFDRDVPAEREIRTIGHALYARADWDWALNGGDTVSMGWKPKSGFLRYRWQGYDESLILYILALGSPSHPIPAASYTARARSYRWKMIYGHELLHAGPLFIHQLSHTWIDFRGIQDDFMRVRGIDYFENSRRATYLQRQYAIRNPRGFPGYGENCWGITASDGPGPASRTADGVARRFLGYAARGAPYGPDDGTIAPWGAIASLPFAPEIVLPAIEHLSERYPALRAKYGFTCSFNVAFPGTSPGQSGWISNGYFGIDQGPILLMIENYRTDFLWKLMKKCQFVVDGLHRAGFSGGWLDAGSGDREA